MACNLPNDWKHVLHSQLSNKMEQQNIELITSALFGDSNIMLNAVASLLTRHHSNKEQEVSVTSPQIDLTNTASKQSLLANVIQCSAPDSPCLSKVGTSHSTENLLSSLEQVHALATANLVASTQRDIAKQLAEASSPSCVDSALQLIKHRGRKDQCLEQKEILRKGKSENTKKTERKRASSKSSHDPPISSVNLKSLDPKALICSYEGCNRKFAWLNHLKYHELTHTNNRQFKCPEDSCGKTFFTAQRLSVHQRTHTGEKPFMCPHQDCGKTFTTAGNLKNHQRIHTGEQPFVCDHLNCNKRFTEQSSLRKHKLTHSGDKPFECNICGKKFTQSGSRRQHLIRHHLDDEIRQSFKEESAEKDVDEDEMMDEERKEMSSNGTSCSRNLQTESSTINAVSCSPQVLVLNNAYPGLSTSESIVLSHGLSDHIVTVKTQVLDHPLSDSQSLSLSHTLLSSEGLHDGVLHGKPNNFVVLSEAPIYEHDENHGDIVYATDILDHEEVTHADYVSSHVDYSGDMTHSNYSSHRELTNGDDFTNSELSHSDNYINHDGSMAVAEFEPSECAQHVNSYTDCKSLSHSYLDSERDIAHADFIGAEEVAVAQYSSIPGHADLSSIDSLGSEFSQTSALLQDSLSKHFHGASQLDSKFTLGDAAFMSHSSCHPDLAYVQASSPADGDHAVVVVEVTNHSSHTLGRGAVDREIYMDPMMECDEEPEKH